MNDPSTLVAFVLAALAVAVVFYGLSRLASSTAREVTVPFAGAELPRVDVKAALERMGCLVSDDGGSTITGFISGDFSNWGQEVTVTAEDGRLRVRSSFSGSQVYGAWRNQANVDRFRVEWQRRAEFQAAAADPAACAASKIRASEVARTALWGGGFAVVAGLALLVLGLFVPSREGAPASSKFRLVGIGLIALGYGLPRVWAAVARLRKKADG